MLRNSAPSVSPFAAAVALTAALFAGSPASAQVQDVEPHWVTVVTDRVNLRCGDGVVWYPVWQLKAGTTLRVDGKGFKWLRVAYPPDAVAFVRAEDAKPAPDGRSVTLARPSRLLAANLHSGLDGSWKALLSTALPPGTALPLVGEVKDASGTVVAYRVTPPAQARAYVSEEFVRPATEEEIARATGLAPGRSAPAASPAVAAAPSSTPRPAATAAPASSSAPQPASPASATAAAAQRRRPVPTIAATPAQTDPVTLDEVLSQYSVGSSASSSAQPSAKAPAVSGEAQQRPAPSRAAATSSPAASAASGAAAAAPTIAATTPSAPAFDDDRPLPSLEDLMTAFRKVMAEPIVNAEIEPLIHEHERLLASLRGKPRQEAAVAHLQRQIALLRIKADLQRNMRKLEEAAERAALASSQIDRKIASLESDRLYPIRGRLVASALYDGKRLPLLYRLQSVEGETPVTIAYVLPDHELDLAAKLGAVVGVEGEKTFDPDLGAPLIKPSRVDVLARPGLEASVPDNDR